MEQLEDKVEKLLVAVETAKKTDRNNKFYYIAGTPEITKALRDLEMYLIKNRKMAISL